MLTRDNPVVGIMAKVLEPRTSSILPMLARTQADGLAEAGEGTPSPASVQA
jgi:hypothetical protein